MSAIPIILSGREGRSWDENIPGRERAWLEDNVIIRVPQPFVPLLVLVPPAGPQKAVLRAHAGSGLSTGGRERKMGAGPCRQAQGA